MYLCQTAHESKVKIILLSLSQSLLQDETELLFLTTASSSSKMDPSSSTAAPGVLQSHDWDSRFPVARFEPQPSCTCSCPTGKVLA